jgi:protoporphyrinogen oxidase
MTRRVAVIGAGIGGLVAARELKRGGAEVVVYEAGPRVAGMADSHRDPDGFSYDTGAHYITNRLAAALGVADKCRLVRHYGESVWMDGKVASYPFGLLRSPRYVTSALASRARGLIGRPRSAASEAINAAHGRTPATGGRQTAAEWFRGEYGHALADEVVLPLIEAWSGAPADQLSSAVGDKVPGSIAQTMLLKSAARVTGRAVTIGYCREKPQSVNVWHVYPEGGVSVLSEALAAELGGAVHLEAPAKRVVVEDNAVVAIEAGGELTEVDAVVSTAPINRLPDLVEGTGSLDRYRDFQFRAMVFANLRLEGRGHLPDVVTWIPQERFGFFRLTEAPMSMPWLAPEGKTLLTVDIGTEIGSDIWTMDEEELGLRCIDQLEEVVPGIRSRYLGCRVARAPLAYPVFLTRYEDARRALAGGTGVEGLMSIGRNGEFDHILMEDIYWLTRERMQRWLNPAAPPAPVG